ncbi:hypothetical protein GCM10010452_37600 [Crossiella cryophila]
MVLGFGDGPVVVGVASGDQRRGNLVAGYLRGGLRLRSWMGLWQRFRGQVGLGPKRAARLVRFDWAVHREVVGFSGVTPGVVAGEEWLAVDGLAWPV